MIKTNLARLATLAIAIFLADPASAQVGGVTTGGGFGTDTGGAVTGEVFDTGQQTTGGTTNTGTGTSATDAALSAEDAFARIDRGETVGAVADTVGGGATGGGGLGGGFGAGGGFGGLGGLGGFGGLSNFFGGGTTAQSSQPAIRTRLRSAIRVDPIPPQRLQQNASSRFRALPSSRQMGNLNISVSGRTAVVSGVVRSDRDRRMSELLMRLEPGVDRVENRVIVAP